MSRIQRGRLGDRLSREGICRKSGAPEDVRFRAYRSRDRRLQRDYGPRYWPYGRRVVYGAPRTLQGHSTPTESDGGLTSKLPMPADGHPDAPTGQRYRYTQDATASGYSTCRSVIPGQVTCGTVGVSNQYGRPELGHSLSLQVLGWELPSKYLGASTKIPIISDLFKNKSSSGGSRCLLPKCYIIILLFSSPGGVGRSNPH